MPRRHGCWPTTTSYREVTRYGDGAVGPPEHAPAALLLHALPGSAYIYEGEELGLPEVLDLPAESCRTPSRSDRRWPYGP